MGKDNNDIEFMRMALALAKRGLGRTSPNPLVGAVIVKDNKVVGKGFHRRAGEDHAEVVALNNAGAEAEGATMYVNLEPCNHYGSTPPCTLSIIKSGIKRVVIGMEDPNPLVSGRGIKRLKKAGIEVESGVLMERSLRLNEAYIKYIVTKRPFVILKVASTLDGAIADSTGGSRWITGEASRRYVHRLRSIVDGVMVGAGTVLKDDPELTVRLIRGRNPARIVVDSNLNIPMNSRIIKGAYKTRTIIATTYKASLKKVEAFRKMGIELIFLPYKNGVDINALMDELGEMGITSLLIEGGTRLATSAIRYGIVDKLIIFYAPKIIGGLKDYPVFHELGISELKDAIQVFDIGVRRSGDDFYMEGYFKGFKDLVSEVIS